MGEKINPACLSIDDDRVFVAFKNGILLTDSSELYRTYKYGSIACRLPGNLRKTPRVGQRLRITLWHSVAPVKIEMRQGKLWQTIFEMTKLPEGMSCLAGCGEK